MTIRKTFLLIILCLGLWQLPVVGFAGKCPSGDTLKVNVIDNHPYIGWILGHNYTYTLSFDEEAYRINGSEPQDLNPNETFTLHMTVLMGVTDASDDGYGLDADDGISCTYTRNSGKNSIELITRLKRLDIEKYSRIQDYINHGWLYHDQRQLECMNTTDNLCEF